MQQGTGKVVEIKSQDNFKIQAVPQGPVVFSETLQINRPNQDFTRLFKVPNTGKRYIVHVAKQEPQRGRDSRVQVNLNGAWVIREKDFERGEEEFQTAGLLLNANNSLKIRFKGKTGSHLTLTVVEAGEAGTLLRRRGWERDKDLTQADRVRNNDTNIFDPNEPDSLGGLQPYEGDELLNPDDPESPKLGVSMANDSQATIFVGEFYASLAEPIEENLQHLLANYPIEITESYFSSDPTHTTFKVKLNQANLNNLAENIAILNLRNDVPSIENIVFSSVNTAKTIAVIFDILTQEADKLNYMGLQNKVDKHFQNNNNKIATLEEMRSNIYTPSGFFQAIKSTDLWWLEQTKTTQAWTYGMGQGINIAVIDEEFGFMRNKPINDYPDFKGRILRDTYLQIGGYDDREPKEFNPNLLLNKPGHGLNVASILTAQADDNYGIVGVTPQSSLLPMTTGHPREENILQNLKEIENNNSLNISVVNISQGRYVNIYDYLLDNASDKSFAPRVREFKQILEKLDQKKIIVVASAGNHGKRNAYDTNIPAGLSGLVPIISVGAYDQSLKRAIFDEDYFRQNPCRQPTREDLASEPHRVFASNYDTVDIWAPGKNLKSLNKYELNDNYADTLETISGTSFAAPQVAGALALLKSWKKSLNTAEAKNLLTATAKNLSDPPGTHPCLSFTPHLTGHPPVKGLDVLAAIQHPSINAKPYQSYTGTAQANGTVLINGSTYTTKPNYLDLNPTIQVGDTVTLSGWLQADNSNIPANEIHLLGLVKGAILQPIQSLPTHSALAVKAFVVNQQHYLAVANFYNGSSHQIASDIYRFNNNPSQPQYILDHSLSSSGAYDVEPFKMGNDTFLALINHVGGNSKIFKWDAGQNKFLEFQSLPTFGGTDAEHFEFNGEHYLAIANLWLGTPTLESAIFKWNGTTFVKHQGIPTTGAFRWKAFQIGNDAFLALASYAAYYGGNANTLSRVFKKIGNDFVPIQDIPTLNAYDWEAFSIGNDHYLAVANYGSGEIVGSGDNQVDRRATSSIYRWNGSQFQEFQPIATNGATSWKHFEVNGTHYLILSSDEQFSYIYRWNGNAFEVFRSIASNGNIDWEFANVGNNLYLIAVANYFGSQGYNTPSNVYKFEP